MSLGAQAQKFAYIDSEYVLLHMPEYAEAQTELNNLPLDGSRKSRTNSKRQTVSKWLIALSGSFSRQKCVRQA